MKAPVPQNQSERLAALHRYNILDTPREADFDDIVELASDICGAPISVINLIDDNRQWFKAEVGLGVRETPLDTSICAHVILQDDFVVINDTLDDPRMADNPLCWDEPHLRFYAGARLLSSDGHPVGTLCVLDHVPRDLTALQSKALITLAKQVLAQLELRRSLRTETELRRTAEGQSRDLKSALELQIRLIQEVDHRVKNSLQTVAGMLAVQARKTSMLETREQLHVAMNRIQTIATIHDHLQGAAQATLVDTQVFLSSLIEKLQHVSPPQIRISSQAASWLLDTTRGSALGILVNELVANAIKHGFAEAAEGSIEVTFSHDNANAILRVRDNGRGFSGGEIPKNQTGLGVHVVEAMVKQLQGTLNLESCNAGASVAVRFSL